MTQEQASSTQSENRETFVLEGKTWFSFPEFGGFFAVEFTASTTGKPLAVAMYMGKYENGEFCDPTEVEVWEDEAMRSSIMTAFGLTNILGSYEKNVSRIRSKLLDNCRDAALLLHGEMFLKDKEVDRILGTINFRKGI